MKSVLNQIKKYILDLIFPIRCCSCRKEDNVYICLDCVKKVAISFGINSCLFCGRGTIGGKTCKRCAKKFFLDGCVSLVSYGNPVIQKLIKLYKYEEMVDLEPNIQYLIEKFFQQFKPAFLFSEKSVIIPVPLYFKKEKSRGFNQAAVIANFVSKATGICFEKEILKRVKGNKAQAQIKNYQKRKENVFGIFECKNSDLIKDKTIILVDDVVTTGATLNECAKILKKAGAKTVWGFTIARG